jgi:Protein of unknown function (DUF4199)
MKNKTEIKFAIGFFIMTLMWMAMERLLGLHSTHIDKHATYTNLYAIPSVIIYVLALLERRKYYNGIMSYGQAFKSGLILTLFITILSPIAQYISSVYITPHYFENAINHAVSSGAMTQDAAISEFNLSNYLLYSVIGAPIMGLITTALVAWVVRRTGK